MEKIYKDYEVYIKSHCDAPDYEDTCSARDKFEACEIFARRINNSLAVMESDDYWTPEMLEESVQEVQ